MVADQNVYFDAKVSIFKINDGSQLRDISPYVLELKGLPGQFTVNDITTWGSLGERPGPGIFVAHFTMELLFNMITSVGVWTALNTMFSAQALRAFEYYPAGTTVGNAKISGSAYMPVFEITGRVRNEVNVHAEFHVDNAPTLGTA
jgi:hypothetical protein